MSDNQNEFSIDEDVWASYEYWTYQEVVYLVLGLDPDKLYGRTDAEFSDQQEDTKRRVERIVNGLRNRLSDRQRITPTEAILRLQQVGIDFPDRLVQAVKRAEESRGESKEAAQGKAQQDSGPRKEVKTLRRLLLCIAVDRFQYVPGKNSSAVASMLKVVEKYGMSVSDDTIRNHLKLAYSELDADEKQGFKK